MHNTSAATVESSQNPEEWWGLGSNLGWGFSGQGAWSLPFARMPRMPCPPHLPNFLAGQRPPPHLGNVQQSTQSCLGLANSSPLARCPLRNLDRHSHLHMSVPAHHTPHTTSTPHHTTPAHHTPHLHSTHLRLCNVSHMRVLTDWGGWMLLGACP